MQGPKTIWLNLGAVALGIGIIIVIVFVKSSRERERELAPTLSPSQTEMKPQQPLKKAKAVESQPTIPAVANLETEPLAPVVLEFTDRFKRKAEEEKLLKKGIDLEPFKLRQKEYYTVVTKQQTELQNEITNVLKGLRNQNPEFLKYFKDKGKNGFHALHTKMKTEYPKNWERLRHRLDASQQEDLEFYFGEVIDNFGWLWYKTIKGEQLDFDQWENMLGQDMAKLNETIEAFREMASIEEE